MNYQATPGVRNLPSTAQMPGKKMKRVSDVNAVGPSVPLANPMAYMQPAAVPPPVMDPMMSGGGGSYGGNMMGAFNNGAVPFQQPMQPTQNYGYAPPQPAAAQPQHFTAPQPQHFPAAGPRPQSQFSGGGPVPGMGPAGPNQFGNAAGPPFTMFQQPIVQDMAMQYGQRLADQGKQLVENQFEKWVPVAKLKYYFAVDNKYVINKMRLLFFPFTHKDWSLKYDQENPVQPRYDINAPDLYIPTMAYITYVVVAGLLLGMQNLFSPEKLGIQASSALAYSIFELVVYSITLYVVNIKTNLKTLDLLAFSGYKFVIIVASLMASTLFHAAGYYAMLAYSSLTLGFFLLRTLKTKVLHETAPAAAAGPINYDPYGNPQQLDYSGGRKRKLYFLFLIVGGQAFMAFWLSKHLYLADAATIEVRNMKF